MLSVKNIAQQRCQHHADREAVARCPECGRFFCRECVSEHEDRVLCASCLAKLVKPRFVQSFRLGGVLKIGQLALSIFILWAVFYLLGQILLTMPSAFHEGTVWQNLFPANK